MGRIRYKESDSYCEVVSILKKNKFCTLLTSKTEMNITIPVTIHSADILATGVCIEFSEQFGSERPMLSPAVLKG